MVHGFRRTVDHAIITPMIFSHIGRTKCAIGYASATNEHASKTQSFSRSEKQTSVRIYVDRAQLDDSEFNIWKFFSGT